MTLNSPIANVKGVGDSLEKTLSSFGIHTVKDLIDYYPRRYDDFSDVQKIARIRPGPITIKATIKQARGRYVRRGMHITEAIASDDSGSVRLIWFNQPYRPAAIKAGAEYFISGQYELSRQRFSIMNPSAELASDFPVNTARIVPIYRETKGLKSLQVRKLLREITPLIEEMEETLPAWVIKDQSLIGRSEALKAIHFPSSTGELAKAKRRLGFEELFELVLAGLYNKYDLKGGHALDIEFSEKLAKDFVSNLPFALTDAQRRAVWQIYLDLNQTTPMNRLLEGDVGSGKTVVAAMAALMVVKQGYQAALMAPTEILARQHAETIHKLLTPLGFENQLGLLIGSISAKNKELIHKQVAKGEIKFLVGTHALIQDKVDTHKLGLVVIDEQHRFGVEQRKTLQKKAGHAVHVLNMTATPIPRSLALTLYGEMDISILDEKPPGRKQVITEICSPNSREQLYNKIKIELDKGGQMFVVTPLISDSAAGGKSAETVFKQMSADFVGKNVGLLHGRMKAEEKTETMSKFVAGKLDILVATTVIEVGVDVPNATIMLIEDAERFGLAQIHQLRGRVGRSKNQGYCYLMLSDSSAPSRRLRALESSNDGFKLAELDLEIRGPGAIYGTMQHGELDLRMAQLTDTKMIKSARQTAQAFIDKGENLLQYKSLAEQVQKLRAVTNLN